MGTVSAASLMWKTQCVKESRRYILLFSFIISSIINILFYYFSFNKIKLFRIKENENDDYFKSIYNAYTNLN